MHSVSRVALPCWPLHHLITSANPVVVFRHGKAELEIEVDAAHAPLTSANFLEYIEGGFYHAGTINRAVRATTPRGTTSRSR
jgi:cyclophilin family peptidyl-prolyl cis-trans isomerase